MIALKGVCKNYTGRVLLKDLNFHLSENERIGLVGPNGSGKSTLLKIMVGDVSIDGGSVIVPKGKILGYLPQDGLRFRGQTLHDEAKTVFRDTLELARQIEGLREELEKPGKENAEIEALVIELSELEGSPPSSPTTMAETSWAAIHAPTNATTATLTSTGLGVADGRIALRTGCGGRRRSGSTTRGEATGARMPDCRGQTARTAPCRPCRRSSSCQP